MRISNKGLELIKKHEGFSSKPYLCPAGKPTIGIGMTFYPNHKKVTLKDSPITEAQAIEMLKSLLIDFETAVNIYTLAEINQNQFDALVSFSYNVGTNALRNSTLLKKVNKNPNDPTIKQEFLKWNKSNGKVLKGLTNRRNEEAQIYFTL